jgi:thiol-disulfide isomerase/thioredoxin
MKKGLLWFWIIIALLVLGGVVWSLLGRLAPAASSDLVPFAQCLKDKGAVFYGAFWCPHCQNTKKMFGAAAANLPYVECSTPDAQGQTQVCKDNGIESYPTWVFPDGSRLSGEQTLQSLADKSGCTLPTSN